MEMAMSAVSVNVQAQPGSSSGGTAYGRSAADGC